MVLNVLHQVPRGEQLRVRALARPVAYAETRPKREQRRSRPGDYAPHPTLTIWLRTLGMRLNLLTRRTWGNMYPCRRNNNRGRRSLPMLRSDVMSVKMTVTVSVVSETEQRVSVPLAPSSPPAEGPEHAQQRRREDKVLPLGSSILSPGLRLRVGG
jgi:hypothetical protein